MQRHILTTAIILLTNILVVTAQRKIIVYDIETKTPIRQVWVWADTLRCDSTNYRGEVQIPDKFDMLILSKPTYVALHIPSKYVTDSIPLIKKEHSVAEVVVYGKDMTKELNKTVQKWTKQQRDEYALQHPNTGVSLDFFSLFNPKERKRRKMREKQKAIFDQWDEQEKDPIFLLYQETLKKNMEGKESDSSK